MRHGDSRFDGNCGMFAIAVAEAARRAGKSARFVLAYEAESDAHFQRGTFHLYHVAVEIDGVMYDARGRIEREEDVLAFMPPPPPAAHIARFEPDEQVRFLIRRRTKWTVSFEKYAEEAEQLVAELGSGATTVR